MCKFMMGKCTTKFDGAVWHIMLYIKQIRKSVTTKIIYILHACDKKCNFAASFY